MPLFRLQVTVTKQIDHGLIKMQPQLRSSQIKSQTLQQYQELEQK